jgi:hypothetical protein
MKLALAALVVLLASACVSTTDRYGYRDRDRAYYPVSGNVHGTGHPQGQHLICHKGKKTLSLPASAIDAHMGHGDRRGPC